MCINHAKLVITTFNCVFFDAQVVTAGNLRFMLFMVGKFKERGRDRESERNIKMKLRIMQSDILCNKDSQSTWCHDSTDKELVGQGKPFHLSGTATLAAALSPPPHAGQCPHIWGASWSSQDTR